MADISEDRVDLLEEKLRAKIDTMTGFSDVEGKSRALHKVSWKRLRTLVSNEILERCTRARINTIISCSIMLVLCRLLLLCSAVKPPTTRHAVNVNVAL